MSMYIAKTKLIYIVSFFSLALLLANVSGCTGVGEKRHDNEQALTELSCEEQLERYAQAEHDEVEVSLSKKASEFEYYAEKALDYRAKTISFYKGFEEKLESGVPLSGQDLDILNKGMVDHLEVRQELLDVALGQECWLDTELADSDISVVQHTKGIMISLAAALVLYDNYLLAVSTFEENPKLRQLLNSKDSGYQIRNNELVKVTLSYASAENRKKTRKAIKLYEQRKKSIGHEIHRDPEMAYLSLIIDQSPSYNMTKTWSPLFNLGQSISLFGEVTVDMLNSVSKDGVNLFSMVFGNTLGLVELRKGKLYDNPSIEKSIKDTLEPGDILLEKTPFRLTDRFIPGHWGHAAIWVGNEEQLRKLGIWGDPLVVPHHESIQAGHGVVEALRGGTTISKLSHFMNVDDVAVLRNTNTTQTGQAQIVLQAFRQVGKAYDFNFDVETTDKIVCSELIYHSYLDFEWPTEKKLGRSTISPDNIAMKAFGKNKLELILLYHDGERVMNSPLGKMKTLLSGTELSASN